MTIPPSSPPKYSTKSRWFYSQFLLNLQGTAVARKSWIEDFSPSSLPFMACVPRHLPSWCLYSEAVKPKGFQWPGWLLGPSFQDFKWAVFLLSLLAHLSFPGVEVTVPDRPYGQSDLQCWRWLLNRPREKRNFERNSWPNFIMELKPKFDLFLSHSWRISPPKRIYC